MKKTKFEIKKIQGLIIISNEITTVSGFYSWSEARKFLKYLKNKKYVKTRK